MNSILWRLEFTVSALLPSLLWQRELQEQHNGGCVQVVTAGSRRLRTQPLTFSESGLRIPECGPLGISNLDRHRIA